MKKFTKEQMAVTRLRNGRISEMKMIAYNKKVDGLRKADEPNEKNTRHDKPDNR